MIQNPTLDELRELYGQGLVAMEHSDYVNIVALACPSGLAIESCLVRARQDPQTRLTNLINGRVLRFIHRQDTGQAAMTDGLDVFDLEL